MKKAELEEALAASERALADANRELGRLRTDYEARGDALHMAATALVDMRDRLKTAETGRIDLAHKYAELSQAVGQLMDRVTLTDQGKDALLTAMKADVILTRKEAQEDVGDARDAQANAEHERDAALVKARQELEIRCRVHARFKRMRRENVLAADKMKSMAADITRLEAARRTEAESGRRARELAQLAHAVLESEEAEDAGREPRWP